VITPTCQVCGTTLNLENGSSIETIVRRGAQDDDPDVEAFWDWHQELRYRFCGEEHMKSWMSALSLPSYEPPAETGKSPSPFEALGIAACVGLILIILTGAVFGFILLLERTL
jgi:hypothetical protein